MPYFDTHVHLDDEQFDADCQYVLDRARQAGVQTLVCPGITADSSANVVRLAEAYPAVYAAVGIQPNYCAEGGAADWDRVVAMAESNRVVAVGETGLDRHWDFTPFDVQQVYFDRHLQLAVRLDLPVIIHCREAEADLLPMLRQAVARGPLRGVLHAFSGDRSVAEQFLELGLYVSFAGAVTYRNKKFEPLRQAAASIPPDRLLIETDSPYLVPHPLRGKQKRNEPSAILHTAECLAGLRGTTVEVIAEQTTANARRLFQLD